MLTTLQQSLSNEGVVGDVGPFATADLLQALPVSESGHTSRLGNALVTFKMQTCFTGSNAADGHRDGQACVWKIVAMPGSTTSLAHTHAHALLQGATIHTSDGLYMNVSPRSMPELMQKADEAERPALKIPQEAVA